MGTGAGVTESGTSQDRASVSVVNEYLGWAVAWLLIGSVYGTLAAWKLVYPDLLPIEWLSFGRLRPIHTTSIFFGWLSIGLIGLAYLVVYRTANRPLFSPVLARLALALLNLAIVAGLITLSLGMTRGPLEYREWLTPVAALFAAGLILNGINVFVTLLRRRVSELYIANWFILGAYAWAPILYVIAYLPIFDRGMANVLIQGYYMHVVLGLWFTPLVVGITYWVLPRLLRRPIYSYALGVLAFWANLVFYPLIGAHHFLFAPLPWWLQTTAIVFSVAMLVPVWGGSANFLLTMRGRVGQVAHSYPLAFCLIGVLGYLVGSTQGTFEAFRSLQATWHFTNFTVGHSHLTMYGFVTFALWGALYTFLPLATGKQASRLGMGAHFWMAVVGSFIYVISLSIAGTVQGLDWSRGVPFIQSVVDMSPYYVWRGVGGVLMFSSHLVFAWNVWRMTAGPSAETSALIPPLA